MADAVKLKQEKLVKKSRDKSVKFIELAQKRMTSALAKIHGIGNLSNRNSYTYDPAQVRKMMSALVQAVQAVEARFNAPAGKQAGGGFTF